MWVGTPLENGIIFWRVGSLYRLPPLCECSRNPPESVYQLILLWEAVFSEFFWRLFQCICPFHDGWFMCTPAHTCWVFSSFWQKWRVPHAPPSLFTWSCPKWLFFLTLDEKNCSKGNILLMWKRWNKKNGRSTKRHQNWWVQKLF